MARPVVLSNGELHVGINKYGLVHDFYYPYVGLENHAAGANLRHRVGVWVEGMMSWLDDDQWDIKQTYQSGALIGHTVATSSRLGVVLEFDDFIDSDSSSFMRNIHIVNQWDRTRNIRLFMHQAFVIGDSRSNTDTAQYLPDSHAILHYRGRRAFVVAGTYNDAPFDQHSVGLFGIEGHEGTYRDAEDGELSNSNVEHGRVDSTIRFNLELGAFSSSRVQYWIAAGTSIRKALTVHKHVRDVGFHECMEETVRWWRKWLEPAEAAAQKIDPKYRKSFINSMLIVKSQIDMRGAVIASTDTAMLNYARDSYAYCWPRDGAYALWPLVRMGYIDEPYRFFDFCREGLNPNGYLMHKYRADGALGSSWHPYVDTNGTYSPPIQEDETALVLFVFAQYYSMNPSAALLEKFYESMIKPMADFMTEYIDETTGLPLPSYDLWEQFHLTLTYTTATVYAALLAAADLAEAANDSDSAVNWRSAADDIQQAAHKYLYNKERKIFYKAVTTVDGEVRYDDTIDASSVFGAFMFGLFAVDSEELVESINTLKNTFGVTVENPGMPRFENDDYNRAGNDITGNWWYITTLWLVQYYIETGDMDAANSILDWVNARTFSTGVLAEQINPHDSSPISVAPLTWSHAEYVSTLLDTIAKPSSSK